MIEYLINSRPGKLHTFLNPYSYLLARKNKDIFSNFSEIHFDGIVLCVVAKIFGIKKDRTSFDMTSLAPLVMQDASEKGKSIYIIGSDPGLAIIAANNLTAIYSNLKIVGLRHGYFSSLEEREQVIHDISCLNPDIVIAGMGTPHQEKLLVDLTLTGWSGTGYTCGGFIHQTAKSGAKYYPLLFDKLNLRWLYRIYDEPKLLKRYVFEYPKFFYFFIADYRSYKKSLNRK